MRLEIDLLDKISQDEGLSNGEKLELQKLRKMQHLANFYQIAHAISENTEGK